MISPSLYGTVFLYTVIILTLIVASKLYNQGYQSIRRGNNNCIFALVICVVFALWVGFRPISPAFFGDTYAYYHSFELMKNNVFQDYSSTSDRLWNIFSYWCSQTMSATSYFTIVSLGYFGLTYVSCRIAIKNNVLATYLIMLGAFSFFTYATNGIRNGLACSIVLLCITLYLASSVNKLWILPLGFIAINIHKSTLLPLVSFLIAIYYIKTFKQAYAIWVVSIIISLVAGGVISSLFASLGFDDRLSYLTSSSSDKFSRTGFRWDFLVYSMMPIILGYYVIIKHGIRDKRYELLLNTYILANAFWVMIIRANYSNRFAYLSWFMYPLVLAYPLFKLDIWGQHQGKNTSKIMLAHVGFTWVMQFLY